MKSKIFTIAIVLLLLVTLTVAAEDVVHRYGCRRGVMPNSALLHRAASTPRQAGGDFYHGDRHQLVVLAAFKDRTFKNDEAAAMEQWNKIFNAENYHENPFVGSVHDYFYTQSYGKFNVTFDLHYVALADSCKKYRSTADDDENSQYLVDDIVDSLMNRGIDWSPYDWNGDGYVNQVLIVYAGKGSSYGSFGGGYDAVWPHQWWLSCHLDLPSHKRYRSYRTVSSGGCEYKVDCYCVLQELYTDGSYGSFGTICHEYTHCFGFPDFYYGSSTKVVGDWDLMDNGNYNGGGYRPCDYSAHERWLMGWLTPSELTSDVTVADMPALCDEPQAYMLRNDGFEDEYYFIENRQQRGWDSSLPGNGIVVFHINFDKDIWVGSSREFANNDTRKRYYIIPANNSKSTFSSSMSGWPYPYQANDSLTNNSTPAAVLQNANTDGSMLMNKSLYDMKVEDGLASFRFVAGQSTGVEELRDGQPYKILYDFGPVIIIRYSNGEIKKVMKR